MKDPLDFTGEALNTFYDAVDDMRFKDQDAELIYKALAERMRPVPFCEYLKRYVYRKTGLSGDYRKIPQTDYELIVRAAFSDNYTPPSFQPVKTKLSAVVKNWFSQHTVRRNVVFLLGFGLRMSVSDVNEFLTKVLREPGFNFKDPFEIICWYCYKNGYGYPKFEQLWRSYEEISLEKVYLDGVRSDRTVGLTHLAMAISDDASLLAHVAQLKTADNVSRVSVTSRIHFDRLYEQAKALVAHMYNETEKERFDQRLAEYMDRLSHNGRISDTTKRKYIEQMRTGEHTYSRDDITPGDIERILCAAIPVDQYGNRKPLRESKLGEHFHGKKFSRQRMEDILMNRASVGRFDLITLNFFLFSQKTESFENSKQLYSAFVESTNSILEECSMGDLYAANPYECFVLMCILAEDPLGTYADVWEMAYEEQEESGEEAALT